MLARRAAFALAVIPFAAQPFGAWADDAALNAAIREQVGGDAAEEGGITLRVPPVAENGGQVPLTILVDSPQSAAEHVTAIHVFATRNPTPGIASFRLTPHVARAEVQTRMRIAENQNVIVVAQMNDGRLRRAAAEIRVSAGGCLT